LPLRRVRRPGSHPSAPGQVVTAPVSSGSAARLAVDTSGLSDKSCELSQSGARSPDSHVRPHDLPALPNRCITSRSLFPEGPLPVTGPTGNGPVSTSSGRTPAHPDLPAVLRPGSVGSPTSVADLLFGSDR